MQSVLCRAVGYAWAFVIMLVLQVLSFLYIVVFARELHQPDADSIISHSTDQDIGIGNSKFS